jgi:Na+-transporting methylmalonyl-CoA/oxaloacetate decarboxylase gamma subunit
LSTTNNTVSSIAAGDATLFIVIGVGVGVLLLLLVVLVIVCMQRRRQRRQGESNKNATVYQYAMEPVSPPRQVRSYMKQFFFFLPPTTTLLLPQALATSLSTFTIGSGGGDTLATASSLRSAASSERQYVSLPRTHQANEYSSSILSSSNNVRRTP